jgi:hypothetical protein
MIKKPRIFTKWSATAIGTIYKDKKGQMYFYDKSKDMLVGLSPAIKGKQIRVRAKMGEVI